MLAQGSAFVARSRPGCLGTGRGGRGIVLWAVAGVPDRSYVKGLPNGTPMHETTAPIRTPRPLLLGFAVLGGLILAGTVALWAHYGSTVFFEMIRAGFIACFG